MSKSSPVTPPANRTALSGYVLAMVHAMAEAGVDHRALMNRLGMEHQRLEDFGYRYSQEKVTQLWRLAVESTGDPNFGLKVAKHIRPSSYHVVGQAMLCSDTLRSASRRFARFAKLISDSAVVNFTEREGACELSIALETGGSLPRYQAFDTVLAGFLEYCRWMLHDDINPRAVAFSHSVGEKPEEYEAFFQCPISYESDTNVLVFDAADMDRAIPGANDELASLLDELASRYLLDRLQGRFSRRVREVLLVKLPNGEPSRAETAHSMAMTERTLARRLTEENTTFYEILKQLREEQAYSYLKHTELNIEEIAYLLGFSDRGTFSRAFKSWTGKRPTEWRSEQVKLLGEQEEAASE
ncbi:DNA-binding domain-containing protein, AraC-type [Spongiibacter sp. IMCC21906]|uniref:AraC family transcriptional regulator n=1 Tax=Spongiibacter sp. IMCC21906 TaxID=1620392 RepID=UPI00062DCF02|nr:AraC family transcriptional regulator [Spongiibacter sp. IMCC21906]AKH70392.1 DNA-binding domain-containing protein, AraC-type [Spongiibacter sp. IMCC21906]